MIRSVPVALSVRSLMNRNDDSGVEPHACGSGLPGGLISGQMSYRRSMRSM